MSDETETEGRKPTERLVFQQVRVLPIPANASEEQLEQAAIALASKGGRGKPHATQAWVVVDQQVAATKDQAIRAYAGEPGTPDAKIGRFKAPTMTAWKGTAVYEAPPEPLVQRTLLDD